MDKGCMKTQGGPRAGCVLIRAVALRRLPAMLAAAIVCFVVTYRFDGAPDNTPAREAFRLVEALLAVDFEVLLRALAVVAALGFVIDLFVFQAIARRRTINTLVITTRAVEDALSAFRLFSSSATGFLLAVALNMATRPDYAETLRRDMDQHFSIPRLLALALCFGVVPVLIEASLKTWTKFSVLVLLLTAVVVMLTPIFSHFMSG